MAEPTIRFDLVLRPITSGPKSQVPPAEYALDGSGRDYSYDYDEIQEARRVVEAVVVRGDDLDSRRQTFGREAKSADWGKVLRLGLAVLSEESKDLRVAAWVIEALGHLRGFTGLRDGFSAGSRANTGPRPTHGPTAATWRRGPPPTSSSTIGRSCPCSSGVST